jgi:hypothetical protein
MIMLLGRQTSWPSFVKKLETFPGILASAERSCHGFKTESPKKLPLLRLDEEE